jgi:hypothetical protein
VYTLSPSQQEVWRNQLPKTPRGTQTQIARALARKCKGKVESWKTQISSFFKGEDAGLRAIFEHPARLASVAAELKKEPGELRSWLDTARGVPPRDGPLDSRVPGFEDFGPIPILDVFYSPPSGETRFALNAHGRLSSQGGGQVQLDSLVEVARRSLRSLEGPAAGAAPSSRLSRPRSNRRDLR